MMNIDCVIEYHNSCRLHIWYAGNDLYHWRVAQLDSGTYWTLGGSTRSQFMAEFLTVEK